MMAMAHWLASVHAWLGHVHHLQDRRQGKQSPSPSSNHSPAKHMLAVFVVDLVGHDAKV